MIGFTDIQTIDQFTGEIDKIGLDVFKRAEGAHRDTISLGRTSFIRVVVCNLTLRAKLASLCRLELDKSAEPSLSRQS